jgi:PAS domain S-box-containing protein
MLISVSEAARKSQNPETLYEKAVDALKTVYAIDTACILLHRKNKNSITIPWFKHESGRLFDRHSEEKTNQGLCLEVIRQKKAVISRAKDIRADGFGSIVCLPLENNQTVFGALMLRNDQSGDAFQESDLGILAAVADTLALSMGKEEKEKEFRRIEEINRVVFEITTAIYTKPNLEDLFASIHHSLGRIIDVTNFYISLYNKETNILTFPFYRDEFDDIGTWDIRYLKTDSLTNEVFQVMKPVFLHQEDLELRAARNGIVGTGPLVWAGIPLLIRGEIRGILVVQSYSDPDLYDMDDVTLLNSFSEQIAIAIDRTAAFEQQAESEKKFRLLFNHIADPVVVFDKKTHRFLDCNGAFLDIYGYTREEVLRMTPYDLHPAEDLDLVHQRIDTLNKHTSNRYTHMTKGNRAFPVAIRSEKTEYNGQPAFISTIRDITEHLQLENELREHQDHLESLVKERTEALEKEIIRRKLNETKYKTLFDSSSDAVFLFDQSGFFDCNTAALDLFRVRSKEEFLSLHLSDLSPKVQPCGTNSMDKARAYRKTAYQKGGVHFEWIHKKYGTDDTFPADVLLNTMELDGKIIVQAVVRDITSLRQAQKEREAMIGTKKEMEIAKNIQTSLLPSLSKFVSAGFEISANMTPAEDVGGDYYDVIRAPDNRLWFGIGDVTGHGLVSGLIMMMAQVSVNTLIRSVPGISPEDLLIHANEVMQANIREGLKVDHHMTINFIVEEYPGHYRYAGAHEIIFIFRASSGEVEQIPTKGMWLGIIPDISKPTKKYAGEFYLEKNDLLVLYTDGVIQLCNEKREQYDISRLEAFIKDNSMLPTKMIKHRLLAELNEFMHHQTDDITFLIMRKK